MTLQKEKDRALSLQPQGSLESPFLDQELFAEEPEAEWESRLEALEAESLFRYAFEPGRTILREPEVLEDEFVEEEERSGADYFPVGNIDSYDEDESVNLEDEVQYLEGETEEKKALARMKFEFQTKNRIYRYDSKTKTGPTLLPRKYGSYDYLVNEKREGVRLESETDGVLEFETEWFRKWKNLEKAIEKAVEMTQRMNGAEEKEITGKRLKKFPFDVNHLRIWKHIGGMEGGSKQEKPLGKNEELYVEIIDPCWWAGIQASECFLLEYYESFLRQYEWPEFINGAIKLAEKILDAANTYRIPVTQLVKLRSFLQIIVNYIMRGQDGYIAGVARSKDNLVYNKPAKQAFALMCRTNFGSMYKKLLTDKEKELFREIVKKHVIFKVLKEMGLNEQSLVFTEKYGKTQFPNPTIHQWLRKIISGVDLLSGRSRKGLSDAMGWYYVTTKEGEKDRWLVKFEIRNRLTGVPTGAWRTAKEGKRAGEGCIKYASDLFDIPKQILEESSVILEGWVKYASDLFRLGSNRERDALKLAYQQGITDENQLANFVIHARHPDLKGLEIPKGNHKLAQELQRIRDGLVRPLLLGVQTEVEEFDDIENQYERSHYFISDSGEQAANKEEFPETQAHIAEEQPLALEEDELALDKLIAKRIRPARTVILLPPAIVSPEGRAFFPSRQDKSGITTLRADVRNAPAGATFLWSAPVRGTITIDSPHSTQTLIRGVRPGLTKIDFSVHDSGGTRLASVKIRLSVPQFVTIDQEVRAFDAVLTGWGLQSVKAEILREAKAVCDHLLRTSNVRTIWLLAPFGEALPAHITVPHVTALTIRGESPASALYGRTNPGAGGAGGAAVFNETIDIFPGAYDETHPSGPLAIEVDTETQAIAIQLANRVASEPDLGTFAIKVFGRLIGETMAHEIVHSLLWTDVHPGFHNNPPIVNDLMNAGSERSFRQRTGLENKARVSPVDPANFLDHGIAAIGGLQASNRALMDARFPVPPSFA